MALNTTKFAAWVDRKAALKALERAEKTGLRIRNAGKTICLPLARPVEFGIIRPEHWRGPGLCRRQLSWYDASSKNGLWLVISRRDLTDWGLPPQIILRPCRFKPAALPDRQAQENLAVDPEYLRIKPAAWDDLDAEDPGLLTRWMQIMGIRNTRFADLFLTHCANHANFISPVYAVSDNGRRIPYSIGDTRQVCSACLEFFNVIGGRFPKKLVMPCPGAVTYARMPADRYIEVETLVPES